MHNYNLVKSEGWENHDGSYRESYKNSLYLNGLCLTWFSNSTERYHIQDYDVIEMGQLLSDVNECVGNLDMLLFEGNHLATWFTSVPKGTEFYGVEMSQMITYVLTDKGLERYGA